MKKAIILAIFLTVTTFSLFARAPPHPPADVGTGGGPIGSNLSGAPIDEGGGPGKDSPTNWILHK